MGTPTDSTPTTADSLLEDFFAAPAENSDRLQTLIRGIKQLLGEGRFDEAITVLRKTAQPNLDYTSAQAMLRLYKRSRGHGAASSHKIKLAVLSSFTSDQLVELVEFFLFAAGVDLELYEADYGVFRQEILDPSSHLYEFNPNTIFLATSWRDINHWPDVADDAARVQECLSAEVKEWSALWQAAHNRLGCQILQNNFEHAPWRQLGNHELRHPASQGQFVTQVNQTFSNGAPPFVTIHDVDHLSAMAGRRAWGDERFFHHAKLPCAPEFLVDYAHSVASILLAQLGLGKKCLVLDLDNTLWGGVIGDDGLAGIRVGQGDAEGEGFLAFQRYVKKLQQRGVILAVCSKNTQSVAQEVFLKHSEMVLKLEDISCFVANWEDKAGNIRLIAKQLNIGLDSLVFLDDNPAERAIVRKLAPEVAVPEVSGDPLDFVEALERNRYFQTVSLGREDIQRTEYYRNNAQREMIRDGAGNVEEFLQSLQMVGTIGPITDLTLERSTQLINKSNQFNLTTIRRTAAEVLAIAQDPQWLTRTVSLKDRFGDNGLICVLLAKRGEALEIDTWLMSCRVLKRGVEDFLLNHICCWARQYGLRSIHGHYIPTAKNALVKDHYAGLGFSIMDQDGNGACHYGLELDGWKPRMTFIEERQMV